MKAVDADRQIDQRCHRQGDQVGQVLGRAGEVMQRRQGAHGLVSGEPGLLLGLSPILKAG